MREELDASRVRVAQILSALASQREYVLLMLEATIGLNEVSAKDAADAESGAEEGEEGPFTQNDLHFLRSLRISVEGEEEGASENDTE